MCRKFEFSLVNNATADVLFAFLCLFACFVVTAAAAGEVTFVERKCQGSRFEITYFDTMPGDVVCTVFFEDKPVGQGRKYSETGGVSRLNVFVPGPVCSAKPSSLKYICKTQ